NLSKAGWSWGCVSTINSNGRTIWITDANRDDGKRFIVHADEKLNALVELERAVCIQLVSPTSHGAGKAAAAVGYWRNVRTPNEHPHGHASASHPNPDRAAARTGNEFSSGKCLGEGGGNLTTHPGSGPRSPYEKEI